MPPGYVNPCPQWVVSPLMPWLTIAWISVYVLGAETVLLGLGLIMFRLQRFNPHQALVSTLLVIGCAAGAIAVALWITGRNAQSCSNAANIHAHVTAATHAQLEREYGDLLTQAHIALAILAAMFVLATTLIALTFIRGWRGNRRRSLANRS